MGDLVMVEVDADNLGAGRVSRYVKKSYVFLFRRPALQFIISEPLEISPEFQSFA